MDQGLILETARLQLRKFTLRDVDALEKVLGDAVTMQFYVAAYSREGVTQWIERNMARYERGESGLWAMILRSTGELIGDCGCVLQEVEGRKDIEIGYHVRRDLWGNGYATEAARACMDYAFDKLGVERVISMIRPGNVSSKRVAEKNGLICEKVVFWHGFDHCKFVKHRQS